MMAFWIKTVLACFPKRLSENSWLFLQCHIIRDTNLENPRNRDYLNKEIQRWQQYFLKSYSICFAKYEMSFCCYSIEACSGRICFDGHAERHLPAKFVSINTVSNIYILPLKPVHIVGLFDIVSFCISNCSGTITLGTLNLMSLQQF